MTCNGKTKSRLSGGGDGEREVAFPSPSPDCLVPSLKKVMWFLVILSWCRFFLRFAISGKEEDWQEALSSGKSNVNVISVTSTKRKAHSSEEQTKTHKKHKKHKAKHKTGWTAFANLYIKACFSSRPSELPEQQRKGFRTSRRNVNIFRYESSTNLKSAEKNMVEKTLKIYYDKVVRLLQGVCI